ncbi:uncharacterized protein F4822DRAFT_440606 [Hypoxylon trugodes]|uniref:uncharacterized protein n=1 Tax=Hypoxylon trugodes TaxID=326681 RepID=UPI0021A06EE9|nr:uncharacterized protein F4822DRAFT_440606 [Hypoxylon trugodes]KAI1383573.1 hypothetical protein F4822DRAFT_440606 [Hypoxylon trugodes]
MKFIAVATTAVAVLISGASALYADKTCSDLVLDPSNEVLTANCNDKKGNSVPNTFDLNTCFGYDSSSNSIFNLGSNFGASCNNCYLEDRLVDEWEAICKIMICNCNGHEGVEVNLRAAEHLGNIDGTLTCCQYAC